MTSPAVLLITPRLSNRFAQALALRLITDGDQQQLIVLVQLQDDAGEPVPDALAPHIARGTARVEFGSPGNAPLLRNLLQHDKIRTVFLLFDDADDDNQEAHQDQSAAERVRAQLIPLCALLECLRQSTHAVTLVSVVRNACPERVQLLQVDSQSPVVHCTSDASARFSAAHALMHAYAVSYRLNVQLALVEECCEGDELTHALDFVLAVACKEGGKAPISVLKTQVSDAAPLQDSLCTVRLARLLLFGAPEATQRAKTALTQVSDASTEVRVAETQLGKDTDEVVQAEVLKHRASHLVYVQGADESTMRAWEAGGPANLLDNVRHNLYAPWLLAHLARRQGLRFWTVDEQGRRVQDQQQKGVDAKFDASSRYAVVRHFADQLCGMELDKST